MKILIVSLLRMGDLVMQKHVLQRLLKSHPGAQLDLLTHAESKKIRFLLPEVKNTFYFDRNHIQKILNQPEENILRPIQEIQSLVQSINNENYDLVLNWTHQRISAYFMNLIVAGHKKGLVSDGKNFHLSGNQHLCNFDLHFSNLEPSRFHYIDYLSLIEGFRILGEENRSQKSAPERSKRKILVHPLSSDSKKNWSLINWSQAIQLYRQMNPQDEVFITGARFEAALLSKHFSDEELLIADLETTFSHLQSADWLISADTVTKHLASWAGAKVIELALGSSQSTKTGAWGSGNYIIEPQQACYPCSHSQACTQVSQLCAERISMSHFAETVDQIVNSKSISYSSDLKVYQTSFDSSGYWKSHLIQGGPYVSRSRELSFASA